LMILLTAKPGLRRRTEHSKRVCPQAPVPQGFRGSNPTPRRNDGTPRSRGVEGVGEHPLPRTILMIPRPMDRTGACLTACFRYA